MGQLKGTGSKDALDVYIWKADALSIMPIFGGCVTYKTKPQIIAIWDLMHTMDDLLSKPQD